MAATFDQIETALQAAWDSGWTATPSTNVAATNVAFDPSNLPPSSYWMETAVSGGPQTLLTTDDAFIGTPTMIVTAHTPLGTGKQAATQLLDAAAAIYRGVQIPAGTSTLRAYAFSRPVEVPKDGWFSLAMQISFRLF